MIKETISNIAQILKCNVNNPTVEILSDIANKSWCDKRFNNNRLSLYSVHKIIDDVYEVSVQFDVSANAVYMPQLTSIFTFWIAKSMQDDGIHYTSFWDGYYNVTEMKHEIPLIIMIYGCAHNNMSKVITKDDLDDVDFDTIVVKNNIVCYPKAIRAMFETQEAMVYAEEHPAPKPESELKYPQFGPSGD